MQVCSWEMWPRLHSAGCWESPPHHSFSTGHFLSLETRRLGICVYLPCRRSLNPRLRVVSDAPHWGTRGQTDNVWYLMWSKPRLRLTRQRPSKLSMPFSGDISRQLVWEDTAKATRVLAWIYHLERSLLHSQWAWRNSRNCCCSLDVGRDQQGWKHGVGTRQETNSSFYPLISQRVRRRDRKTWTLLGCNTL